MACQHKIWGVMERLFFEVVEHESVFEHRTFDDYEWQDWLKVLEWSTAGEAHSAELQKSVDWKHIRVSISSRALDAMKKAECDDDFVKGVRAACHFERWDILGALLDLEEL
jgi:hypothetical protein